MFSLYAALQNVRKYYPYNKQDFESVVTAYLSQSSSNTGCITILFSSDAVFNPHPPTQTRRY